MCNDHKQHKRGTSLKNKEAHAEDHKMWSRRGFLHSLGLAGGAGMAFGGMNISALASGMAMPYFQNPENENRILVMIRLSGGNDGLNMIVPTFDYGRYQSNRPNIAIRQNELLDLNGAFALPNTMQGAKSLWNEGSMKVINTVGYEDHNLSHFSSSDIWNSSNQNIEADSDQSGWLGRYILDKNPDYLENLPNVPGAIKISSGSSIAFHNDSSIDLAVNFNTPERLLSVAESGLVYDTVNLPDDCYYGEQVGFLRSILNVTFNYAPQISAAYNGAMNSVEYSQNELSRQLAIVSRLIKGNLGTKLYMVTLNGFDTHENQNQNHPQLMNALSNAVSEFYADLANANMDNDVLSLTFSEFGRRIRENDGGTDHGTAAPVMLFGPALEGNDILGDNPDLLNTDENGNLHHSVDFRSIYATVLESWLCMDAAGVDAVLGDSYDRLDGLGFSCLDTNTNDIPLQQSLAHSVRPDGQGAMRIMYKLARPGNVDVSIYSVLGQKITTLASGYQLSGDQEVLFINKYGSLTAPFVYRILVDGKTYSGKFVM